MPLGRRSLAAVVLALAGGLALFVSRGGGGAGEVEVATHAPVPASKWTKVASAAGPKATAAAAPSFAAGPVVLARTMPTMQTTPTMDDVLAPDAPTATLVTALESADPFVVAEAANALVARGSVSTLPALLAYDVLARPKAAPSILYALGRIGAVSEPDQRAAVVERLLALMAEEKRRGAQESQGNVLQIYEALGDTGAPQAIAPLERELLDASVPTAPKVVVVRSLVALGAQQSRGVLGRVAAELERTPVPGFEGELRADLLATIREALAQLS